MLLLRPSKIHGIGVFTTAPIKAGSPLHLFARRDYRLRKSCNRQEQRYCIKDKNGWHGPADFARMSIGWFLNSSNKPNVEVYKYRALRRIGAGEELTIDYHKL